MTTYFTGGEEIDFPNGISPTTYAGGCRGGNWARGSISCAYITNELYKSKPFKAGNFTSGWLTFRWTGDWSGPTWALYSRLGGLGKNGSQSGIFTYVSNGYPSIAKTDGNNTTVLATGITQSAMWTQGLIKFDMQVINYGNNNAQVSVFINGKNAADVTYTGNISLAGISAFDIVVVDAAMISHYGTRRPSYYSEFIVSSEDTRAKGLFITSVDGYGANGNWTGDGFNGINELANNDLSLQYTNNANDLLTMTLANRPAGTYSVKAVNTVVRACKSNNSNISELALGVGLGNNEFIGNNETLTAAFDTYSYIQESLGNNSLLVSDMNNMLLALKTGV